MKKAFLISGLLSIIMTLSSCAVSQQSFTDSIYSQPGNKTIKTTTVTSNKEDEEEVRITDDGDIEIGGFHINLQMKDAAMSVNCIQSMTTHPTYMNTLKSNHFSKRIFKKYRFRSAVFWTAIGRYSRLTGVHGF